LIVGSVDAQVGVKSITSSVNLTANSVTVNNLIQSNTGVTLTSVDTAGAGQDITVNANIGANNNSIVLNAGDNINISGGVTLDVFGVITLNGDFGNADAGVGTVITLNDANAFNATGGAVINGNTDADTFNIRPQVVTDVNVVGNNPTTAPGDVLNLNLVGATGGTFTPSPVVGSGAFDFTNRFGVDYSQIETL